LSQIFFLFADVLTPGPLNKEGIIANIVIIPKIRHAWFKADKNIGSSLALLSWVLLTI
jgi:hypothetical protein